MKKLIILLIAVITLFTNAPALAGITSNNPPAGMTGALWRHSVVSGFSISVTGSIVEGQNYQVVASGVCPASDTYTFAAIFNAPARTVTAPNSGRDVISIVNTSMTELASSPGWSVTRHTDPVDQGTSLTSAPLVAGRAGTSESFAIKTMCSYWATDASASWPKFVRSEIITVTFEAAPAVGAPSNFSVFPQAAGTAFTTWGVANGATSYTVTATPGGATCTTTQNYCVISGLTPGDSYNFSVVATNGSNTGPAVSSGAILLREPVTVGLGLNGGTWRVGETVTAQYVVQGSNAIPTITWYRCNGVVGAMPSPPAPADCSSVGSGASYVLSAGDVGKYITANVFVNNTDPQGQMTASSNQAVLTSGAVAPAPVADPDGKPTVVNIPNPIVSVAGGTEVTITGTGLAGVTGVTVGGLPAIIVSKTDTTVIVLVPVSTKTGLADLTITNSKGSVTATSAIVYTTNPVIKITKSRTVAGFKAGQKVLTAAQKTAVRTLITANPTLTTLSCAARTIGIRASKAELARTKTLAAATCAYAKTLKKTLIVSSTATQALPKSKASRTVALTFKN
jgi:hypothetical protein